MIENSPTSDSEPAGQPDAYARIGACLKEQRTRLGLSRADVGQRLHLAGMIIDDIEKGHVKDLPALYRHGYIRNYARLLELDADALLAEVRDDQPPMLRRVLPPPDAGYHFDKYLKIATYVLVSTMIIPPLLYFSVAGARAFSSATVRRSRSSRHRPRRPMRPDSRVRYPSAALNRAHPGPHAVTSRRRPCRSAQ